ncbi:unnamed protein product, partial [Sphenostylis stenocarpa]
MMFALFSQHFRTLSKNSGNASKGSYERIRICQVGTVVLPDKVRTAVSSNEMAVSPAASGETTISPNKTAVSPLASGETVVSPLASGKTAISPLACGEMAVSQNETVVSPNETAVSTLWAFPIFERKSSALYFEVGQDLGSTVLVKPYG